MTNTWPQMKKFTPKGPGEIGLAPWLASQRCKWTQWGRLLWLCQWLFKSVLAYHLSQYGLALALVTFILSSGSQQLLSLLSWARPANGFSPLLSSLASSPVHLTQRVWSSVHHHLYVECPLSSLAQRFPVINLYISCHLQKLFPTHLSLVTWDSLHSYSDNVITLWSNSTGLNFHIYTHFSYLLAYELELDT